MAVNGKSPPGANGQAYPIEEHTYDVSVVGAGGAGLRAVVGCSEAGLRTACITKVFPTRSHTVAAQGGIAAVLEPGDTFESHIEDTMIAGAGLTDREVVEMVVGGAPAAIERLIELGVPFNKEAGALHLTREGGHSHRRIVHVADATGWAVQEIGRAHV